MLHKDLQRARSFGSDPERYDRTRPSYPRELIDDLVTPEPRSVLDVGCGTGKCARLLLAQGCDVLGIEPDPRMARFARGQGLAVEECTFEAWEAAGKSFDLLTCGQAWHWVDPMRGAEKTAGILHPGGRLALFWNWPQHDPELRAALDVIYAQFAPALDGYSIALGYAADDRFTTAADAVRASGAFTEPEMRSYHWETSYTREQWLDFLLTHSDHQTLPETPRRALFEAIGNVIDEYGGSFVLPYETVLVSAQRLDLEPD